MVFAASAAGLACKRPSGFPWQIIEDTSLTRQNIWLPLGRMTRDKPEENKHKQNYCSAAMVSSQS